MTVMKARKKLSARPSTKNVEEVWKVGSQVLCDVQSLAFGGKGVAKVDGKVIFIDRAVPLQKVLVHITKVEKRFFEARILRTLKRSPYEQKAKCPHFSICGGCSYQHINYEYQKQAKQEQLIEAFQYIAGLSLNAENILPLTETAFLWRYRNKMEYAFEGRGKDLILGLRRSESHSVIDIKDCLLVSKEVSEVVNALQELCKESKCASYNSVIELGLFRHLVVRQTLLGQNNEEKGKIMVQIITSDCTSHEADIIAGIANALQKKFRNVISFVHGVRKSKKLLAFSEQTVAVYGKEKIEETLVVGEDVFRYALSADSFFQPNSRGAEILYGQILEFAELTGSEEVVDLYAGSGGISLVLAKKAKKVLAVELITSAVEDALENKEKNELDNVDFYQGDLAKSSDFKNMHVDVLVCDPPRQGLSKEVVEQIAKSESKKLILVSCNPTTLARDIASLADWYEIDKIAAFDVFPQTAHMEVVAKLKRK